MLQNVFSKVFGSANERLIKKYGKHVQRINALEESISSLSDEDLKARTSWLKERLKKGETLDDILPDAFATVREAGKRVLGQRHYDVQLIGGLVLHKGMIAEMRTGEGKTLVATLPVYLNALSGEGVHVVTINDYLAKRDSEWMGKIYRYLGLSVGCIIHGLSDDERRENYACDITYGTNHELGFDYLRDNMKFRFDEMVQRPFNYAIVDEVDSILIDEARTPLIISGSAENSSELYRKVDKLIPLLREGDYEKDEKQRNVMLTEAGVEEVERLALEAGLLKGQSLYDIQNVNIVHHINCALKAHVLFKRDVDYIVKNDDVIIIDEFTGRMMEGRRFSDGIHQAIEAKENADIQNENQTLASITYQNFFRLYKKLSGMTGTGMTEAAEFDDIYKLRVVDIPTNVSVKRKDYEDEVYLTAKEKFDAVVETIKMCHEKKQPILVGTASIEMSEKVSELLKKAKIPHKVLNARHHEQEANIILQAGQPGAITVATNMAGRGTDIKLGGNPEFDIEEAEKISDDAQRKAALEDIKKHHKEAEDFVKSVGGLYVLGTERHESRRIDNQLRGRAGRQGDVGESKFFISLQDDLMRIFGSERLDAMLRRFGAKEGEVIAHKWITKSIERAQQKVEARNFDMRKHLLKYDDVMNDQRKIIYEQRRYLMKADDVRDMVCEIRDDVVNHIVKAHIPENSLLDQWDIEGLRQTYYRVFGIDLNIDQWMNEANISGTLIRQRLSDEAKKIYEEKIDQYGESVFKTAQKTLLLRFLDQVWKDHLLTLDHLREGINLRAYAQSNPLNEYKREAFILFQEMLENLKEQITTSLAHFEVDIPDADLLARLLTPEINFNAFEQSDGSEEYENDEQETSLTRSQRRAQERQAIRNKNRGDENSENWGYVRRNDPCPCGSGNRYKECHGKV
jgi:preprotein translocase subunit SecA